MKNYLVKNALLVNEGRIFSADVLIKNGRIEKISETISNTQFAVEEIDASGLYLIPGVIDDQVHFREPGLTHKATIQSEARAAVAGGTTSFMEMPNTSPQSTTQALLEEKYAIAAQNSVANYSFFMGVTNNNFNEVVKTPLHSVCGLKIFMGSSTGNMLVDNEAVLAEIFGLTDYLIAIHSESENIIQANTENFKMQYGDSIPMSAHPIIRSIDACYESTKKAVALAEKLNTRLHILHISTEKELGFFTNKIPLENKRITAEVCVHHLWFSADDYDTLGGLIKCNPAIKEANNREALWEALNDDRLDIVATDHAPHTWQEKQNNYLNCPSGLPLVQHSLLMMLEAGKKGKITLENIVRKMCHAPADCFKIKERGYLREGYAADLVLIDLNGKYSVSKENILYKCGWSPLEGETFNARVSKTFVNGNIVFDGTNVIDSIRGERLVFDRK